MSRVTQPGSGGRGDLSQVCSDFASILMLCSASVPTFRFGVLRPGWDDLAGFAAWCWRPSISSYSQRASLQAGREGGEEVLFKNTHPLFSSSPSHSSLPASSFQSCQGQGSTQSQRGGSEARIPQQHGDQTCCASERAWGLLHTLRQEQSRPEPSSGLHQLSLLLGSAACSSTSWSKVALPASSVFSPA